MDLASGKVVIGTRIVWVALEALGVVDSRRVVSSHMAFAASFVVVPLGRPTLDTLKVAIDSEETPCVVNRIVSWDGTVEDLDRDVTAGGPSV